MSYRRRGRPVVRWKDRVKEYMHERVADRGRGIELETWECLDRVRRRFFCSGHSPGGRFQRKPSVKN